MVCSTVDVAVKPVPTTQNHRTAHKPIDVCTGVVTVATSQPRAQPFRASVEHSASTCLAGFRFHGAPKTAEKPQLLWQNTGHRLPVVSPN